MIDGTFDPLDMVFSETEMVTLASKGNKLKYGFLQLMILRSTPVGQYLQPTGNWQDGLVPTHPLPLRFYQSDRKVDSLVGRHQKEKKSAHIDKNRRETQTGR